MITRLRSQENIRDKILSQQGILIELINAKLTNLKIAAGKEQELIALFSKLQPEFIHNGTPLKRIPTHLFNKVEEFYC